MSGIAGLFLKTGGEVAPFDLARMAQSLEHRGPDGTATWCQGAVGMAHCALHTTPESILERLPSANPAGTVVITADARIDNRADLIEALGIRDEQVPDSQLICAGYEAWGENCAHKLIGDFAFSIWDARKQMLFCVRDPMGVKPLYYFDSPDLFAFGSEIKSLLSLRQVPRELDELRIADYLVNLFDDREITFFKGIKRLPAASALSVTGGKTKSARYWALDPGAEVRYSSDGEYADAFRNLFTECVRSRLRSAFPVASTLSGGLDSSAIACLSERLLRGTGKTLHTVSAVFPGVPESDLPSIDERRYVDAVLETGSFRPHYVRPDLMSPMRQNDRMHFHLDEANAAPNLYIHWAMFEEASRHGVRVLLDGFDGDTTVSHGFARLPELLLSMRWRTLAAEIRMLRDNLLPNATLRGVFKHMCVKPIAPVWAFRASRLLRGRFHEARHGNSTLIQPGFARAIGIERRVATLAAAQGARPRTCREAHLAGISDGLYSLALESADKSAAAFGLEVRYPFFDRRLLEFCLALPAEQKYSGGWNRVVFRRAMDGILPAGIQWRPNKGNLGSNFYRKLLACENGTFEEILSSESADPFFQFVDRAAMLSAHRQFQAEPIKEGGRGVQLFAAANLAHWLRQTFPSSSPRLQTGLRTPTSPAERRRNPKKGGDPEWSPPRSVGTRQS